MTSKRGLSRIIKFFVTDQLFKENIHLENQDQDILGVFMDLIGIGKYHKCRYICWFDRKRLYFCILGFS